ncbi:MAG: hypothetical protein WCD68_07595, partial [Candidatus Acidiferrum sp.]
MRTILTSATLLLLALAALFAANLPGEPPQTPATGGAERDPQDQAKPSAKASPSASTRKIPCKTPENAAMCYWTHGRLSFWGTYAPWRIWKVGTQRLLRVCNGPSHFPPQNNDDCTNPEFPTNLNGIYGDPRRWKQYPEMPFPRETEF